MNRRRRTREQLDTLDEQLIEVLRADRPQSVRHLFYRMTDPRLAEPVDKTEHGYKLISGAAWGCGGPAVSRTAG